MGLEPPGCPYDHCMGTFLDTTLQEADVTAKQQLCRTPQVCFTRRGEGGGKGTV